MVIYRAVPDGEFCHYDACGQEPEFQSARPAMRSACLLAPPFRVSHAHRWKMDLDFAPLLVVQGFYMLLLEFGGFGRLVIPLTKVDDVIIDLGKPASAR